MQYSYSDFKLEKEKNFIHIHFETVRILERIADDFSFDYKTPQCVSRLIEKKLPFSAYQPFTICTYKTNAPNRTTDYKKVWGLLGLKTQGIFDGYYDEEDGRVYLGIVSEDAPDDYTTKLHLYYPLDERPNFEKILALCKTYAFQNFSAMENIKALMMALNAEYKQVLLRYTDPQEGTMLAGNHVESLFDITDFPEGEWIEF